MTVTTQILLFLVIHAPLWKNSLSGSCDKQKGGETSMMQPWEGVPPSLTKSRVDLPRAVSSSQ